MRIMILRHGKAETHSISGRDEDRSLTSKGIGQAAWIGQCFVRRHSAAFEQMPERLLSSPARRAQETAKAVSEFLGMHVEGSRSLDIDEPLSGLVDVLHTLANQGVSVVLFVGHNPQLERLVQHLAACTRSSGSRIGAGAEAFESTRSAIELRTGELWVFDAELRAASLLIGDLIGMCHLVGRERLSDDHSDPSFADASAPA